MHFSTAFVAATIVPILMGSAAVAAPVAQQQTQNEVNKSDFGMGTVAGGLAGGGVVALTATHLLQKKHQELEMKHRELETKEKELEVSQQKIGLLESSVEEKQALYRLLLGERRAIAKQMEEEMAARADQPAEQQAKKERESQRARIGEILHANVDQWKCMYEFLKLVTEWISISEWNKAAYFCDSGKHFPGLRATAQPGVWAIRRPDRLWLYDERKWSSSSLSSLSSQFALQPSHKKGLVPSVVHQAQRSLNA
ncbi:MAG: hypothetical protein M1826_000611 [Phylliscum demangeonii]|nr:MAG: hypothetical protein M1826_000611 [Phylliscum demangeonii]